MKFRLSCLVVFCGMTAFSAFGADASERQVIDLPPMMHDQFLANMRDHLLAISEIQAALAEKKFDDAAKIARNRLGLGAASSAACRMTGTKMPETMTSAADNRALSRFMPEEMHRIGFEMHSAADRFATEAEQAAPALDDSKAIGSLSDVTKQCVACHARFRLSGR